MNMNMNMSMMMRYNNPFTASQWQELEHQALVFKYMASGIPVPPDLLRRTTSSSSPLIFGWRFEMGSKKIEDPEAAGRCRRTDGKKWRCNKHAFPLSKYCQRHMHRGTTRNRNHHHPTIKPPPTSQLNTKDIVLINARTTAMRSVDPAAANNQSSSSSLSSKLTMASFMSQMKHDNNNNNNVQQRRNVMMHHNFLEEWDHGPRTTQLSISIPNSSMHDFFQTNKT